MQVRRLARRAPRARAAEPCRRPTGAVVRGTTFAQQAAVIAALAVIGVLVVLAAFAPLLTCTHTTILVRPAMRS